MIKYKPLSAWISVVLGFAFILLTCATLTKMDIVFMKGDVEICRQENLCAFSNIEAPEDILPEGFITDGEEMIFTYIDGEKEIEFDNASFDFRIYMAKTVINNIISFNFNSESNIIVLKAK